MGLIHFDEIDSTNKYILDHFESLEDFAFVSASFQSNGRGRMGRNWVGEKGKNLLFSFVIKDEELISHYKDVSLSCAYVLATAFESMYGLKGMIKWPNDVYLSGKKTCGILLESHMNEGDIDGLIIGIGINVNQIEFPSDLIYPVTSVTLERGVETDIEALKSELIKGLSSYLPSLKENVKKHVEYANSHNELKNKKVFAEIEGNKVLVKALGINEDCSLKLDIDGKKKNVYSGEITFHI